MRVGSVSPGLVATEFLGALIDDPQQAAAIYAERPTLTAEEVADAVLYLLAAPDGCEIHDVLMRPTLQER